jgi:hypothetical protein
MTTAEYDDGDGEDGRVAIPTRLEAAASGGGGALWKAQTTTTVYGSIILYRIDDCQKCSIEHSNGVSVPSVTVAIATATTLRADSVDCCWRMEITSSHHYIRPDGAFHPPFVGSIVPACQALLLLHRSRCSQWQLRDEWRHDCCFG